MFSKHFRDHYCATKLLGIPKFIFWVLALIAIVVLVVPIAIMFGRNKHHMKTMVLVPLYIYPTYQAWDPLLEAIESHPSTTFAIIINPQSGPGPNPVPDTNFTIQIPRLNQYHNVLNVGYVPTNYSHRPLESVVSDIQTYARWHSNALRGMGLSGIFLDETPSEWSDEAGMFYQSIESVIRGVGGFGKRPLIIHNPGTVPSPKYLPYTDLNVIFEGPYNTFQAKSFDIMAFMKSTRISKDKLVCLVHSLPQDMSLEDQGNFLKELKKLAGAVFVTGLSENYYTTFWNGFENWVSQLAKK
ncbi:hypothetical protein HYALB_00004866 [Hymenoscyphus albidus]|uniref:Uncharacterized protein n=1 Tax=Hymenoscyphus albidus TaxID=595503 RepID=A0A9N9LW51_9HELO|nr:hypothetical protein HYALB_00004866 [Hymenoscyphus albidus]